MTEYGPLGVLVLKWTKSECGPGNISNSPLVADQRVPSISMMEVPFVRIAATCSLGRLGPGYVTVEQAERSAQIPR